MTMIPNTLVYICGPLTPKDGHTLEENIAQAVEAYLELTRRGIPSICPHLSALIPHAEERVPYSEWLELDLAVITRAATHVLLLPRWRESQGSLREWQRARRLGLEGFETLEGLVDSLSAGAERALLRLAAGPPPEGVAAPPAAPAPLGRPATAPAAAGPAPDDCVGPSLADA